MKKVLLISIAILSVQISTAQWFGKKVTGNGELITQSFNTSDYDGIAVAGSMDVRLIEGKEGDIKVEAESNIMEHLKVEVKGGTLHIGTKDNTNISTRRGITVTVPVERIDHARISGSGEIVSSMNLKARNMDLRVSGSGDMILNVECANLNATVTGSGDIELSGRTENLTAKVTGSGDLDTIKVKANNVDASVTGSGDIACYVNGGNLRARVTGSGDISYSGKSANIDKKVTGSGDIEGR